MTKLQKLQETIKFYGGTKLLDLNDIIQCKTFTTNIKLTREMYKKELHYDISDNETLSIRLDSNKVKFAITKVITTKKGNLVTIKTFIHLPKEYKKEMYREQIIMYLSEINDNFIGDFK